MESKQDYKKAEFMTRLRSNEDDRIEAAWYIENVFDVAFGDSALFKDHTYQDVLDKLDEFSSLALLAGEIEDE